MKLCRDLPQLPRRLKFFCTRYDAVHDTFCLLSAYEAPVPKTMNNVPLRQEIRPPAVADLDAGLLGNVRAQEALGKAGETHQARSMWTLLKTLYFRRATSPSSRT